MLYFMFAQVGQVRVALLLVVISIFVILLDEGIIKKLKLKLDLCIY